MPSWVPARTFSLPVVPVTFVFLFAVSFLALIFNLRLLTWREAIFALLICSAEDNIDFTLDVESYFEYAGVRYGQFWLALKSVMGRSTSFQELLYNSFVARNIRLYQSSFQDYEEDGPNDILEFEASSLNTYLLIIICSNNRGTVL